MAIGGRTGQMFTDINVTPLTDVFLVLLVIMILIAPLSQSHVLKISPPSFGPDPKTTHVSKLQVDVTGDGRVLLNGKEVIAPSVTTISAAINEQQKKANDTELPMEISADGDALQRNVVAVMDAANGCGVKNLRILPVKL